MSPFDGTQQRRVTGGRIDASAWRAFRAQSVPAQRLFGLLRTLPGADHDTASLAAAMALGDSEILALLQALAAAGLAAAVERGAAGDPIEARYRVSEMGAALRPEWSGAETRSIQRWYDWCLGHVTAAADLLYPQALRLDSSTSTTVPLVAITTPAQASAWLSAEAATVCEAIRAARHHGLGRFAWQLADAIRGWAWLHPDDVDWIAAANAAVAAARATGDSRASAAAYLLLADVHFLSGQLDRAEDACAAVGAHAARSGWLSGSAASHANRGGIHHRRQRFHDALDEYTKALELFRAAGRTASQASLYNNIGGVHLTLGDFAAAVASHRRALVQFRQLGSLVGEARSLEMLAQACSAGGQREAAERALVQAFLVYGRLGDRVGEARTRASAQSLARASDAPAA